MSRQTFGRRAARSGATKDRSGCHGLSSGAQSDRWRLYSRRRQWAQGKKLGVRQSGRGAQNAFD